MAASPAVSAEVATPERIEVLDILRGIALLGMFFVHFHDRAGDPTGGIGRVYNQIVSLFFASRFAAMFAILFGVGFAIQLRRASARGDRFVPRYLRRLLTLAAFGFVAHAFLGFNVLLGYAMWGLPLLLMRNASTRTILVVLCLSLASPAIYLGARFGYDAVVGGPDKIRTDPGLCQASGVPFTPVLTYSKTPTCQAHWQRVVEFGRSNRPRMQSTEYHQVVEGRLRQMRVFYTRPFSWLPAMSFSLFLIGLLALRSGALERPPAHRRLIVAMMGFGLVSWAVSKWLLPYDLVPDTAPVSTFALAGMGRSFFREAWLAFLYIGVVLLLVASRPVWLQRLRAFGLTGRMALTNYFVQIILLDLTFSNYGMAAKIDAALAPVAAVALFALTWALSRWWLAHYRYGPLEWLWRMATLARRTPLRLAAPQASRRELAASS